MSSLQLSVIWFMFVGFESLDLSEYLIGRLLGSRDRKRVKGGERERQNESERKWKMENDIQTSKKEIMKWLRKQHTMRFFLIHLFFFAGISWICVSVFIYGVLLIWHFPQTFYIIFIFKVDWACVYSCRRHKLFKRARGYKNKPST